MHMQLTPTQVQCPGRAVVIWRGGPMSSVWGICMFKGWEYLSVCVHRCLSISTCRRIVAVCVFEVLGLL